MKKLTLKQAAFVVAYLSADKRLHGNATASAREAGYGGNDNTLKSIGSELLAKPHVAAEIDKITDAGTKKAKLSVDKVLKDLEDTRVKAVAVGNFGAAVRCSELAGKYLKMFTERIEQVHTLENVTTEELLALITEIAEAGNVDLSKLFTGDGTPGSDLSDPAESQATH